MTFSRLSAPAGRHALGGTGVAVAAVLLCMLTATPVDARPTPTQGREEAGRELLRKAMDAARTTPYKGVQFVSRWTRTGTTTVLIDVKHRPGSGVVMRVRGTTAEPATAMYEPAGGATVVPSGGLGDQGGELLRLLGRNYMIVVAGTAQVVGRTAQVVEARRRGGSVAARYWIDQDVGLLLRREVLDRQGRVVRATAFIQLELTNPAFHGHMPPAAPSPWKNELDRRKLAELRDSGWPLPRRLAGNLSLFEARKSHARGRPVVHLGYSDGLSLVSLFVQRGQLDTEKLRGWRRTELAGHTVYVRDTVQRRIAWSGRHYVYTLVADATPRTVEAVISDLPHDSTSDGLWNRLSRGFGRLVSWLNPFG